jgi:hypothetical protein
MPHAFDLVVSAENRHYHAWQTRLLCFSALTRLRQAPVVVVHDTGVPLKTEFADLTRLGCRVIEAPSFARTPRGDACPCRNAAGTLLTAASSALVAGRDLLLCDPDMLFTGPVDYDGQLAADLYTYVEYDTEHVRHALRQAGLEQRVRELNATSRIGPPYYIPAALAERIAQRWMAALDTFTPPEWTDAMPAFGIALALEGIRPRTTHMVVTNGTRDGGHLPAPLSSDEISRRPIIHYCYDDETWTKRTFFKPASGSPLTVAAAALPHPAAGTVLDLVMRQVREARAFFGGDDAADAPELIGAQALGAVDAERSS